MTTRNLWILAICLLAISASALFPSAGQAQSFVLEPDAVTGEFVAKVNSAIDDPRLTRVCLYRIDVNSPDPTAEFACLPAASGRPVEAGEEAPSGVGMVFDIPFTVTLVSGQDQVFTARNIATDPNGELMSDPSVVTGRIPGLLGRPMFVVPAP